MTQARTRDLSYEGITCDMAIRVPSPRVVVLTIVGIDVGEFGSWPTDQLEQQLAGNSELTLFVDARAVRGASIDVSSQWALWFARYRNRFQAIHMLTGSRFIEFTASFVRQFSSLDAVMRIYNSAAEFDRVLDEAVRSRHGE